MRDDEIEFMHRVVWAREREEVGDLKIVDEETGRRLPPRKAK